MWEYHPDNGANGTVGIVRRATMVHRPMERRNGDPGVDLIGCGGRGSVQYGCSVGDSREEHPVGEGELAHSVGQVRKLSPLHLTYISESANAYSG